MKVYIGPYKNWFGPYQLAEWICFWTKFRDKTTTYMEKPDYVYKLGEWLAYGRISPENNFNLDELNNLMQRVKEREYYETWLYKFLFWIDSKRKRKIKVRIDKYDTWSMDNTLAHIIHPMLVQLQATQHGSPLIDDEDVPEELRSTSCAPKQNEWDVDNNHFRRWDWVLNEMIFAFESRTHDVLEHDNDWTLDDQERHEERMRNGFRLFGKYYQNLWD